MAGRALSGVDIGTSHIRAAVYRETDQGSCKVDPIPDEDGNSYLSSYLTFSGQTIARLFGERAKKTAAKNAGRTVYGAKRFIGHPVPSKELEVFAFKLINDPRGRGSPSLVRNAVAYLGPYELSALINVPSRFTQEQRRMVQDAAEVAGFGIIGLVPTTYGILATRTIEQLRQPKENWTKILAIDIGAGFLNISIASMVQGAFHMDVTESDRLGGNDFDNLLWHHLEAQAKQQGMNIYAGRGKRRARQRLLSACESAKIQLSDISQTEVFIEDFWDGQDFRAILTRQEFESICMKCFWSITDAIERALASAKLRGKHIDEDARGFLPGVPTIQYLNQQETEVNGMAYMAPLLFDDPKRNPRRMPHTLTATVVTPWSIGIGTGDGIITKVLPRYSKLPAEKSIIITWDAQKKCPQTVKSRSSQPATPASRRTPGPAPVHVFEGDEQGTMENAWLGTVDIESLLPDIIKPNFKIQVTMKLKRFHPTIHFREGVSGKTVYRELDQMGRLQRYQIANMIANEQRHHFIDVAEVDRVRVRTSLGELIDKLQHRVRNMSSPPPDGILVRIDSMRAWLDSRQLAPVESYKTRQRELAEISQAIDRVVNPRSGVPLSTNDVEFNNQPLAPKWSPNDTSRKGPLPAMYEYALNTDEVIEGSVIYGRRPEGRVCTPPMRFSLDQAIRPQAIPSTESSDSLDEEAIRARREASVEFQSIHSQVKSAQTDVSNLSRPQGASIAVTGHAESSVASSVSTPSDVSLSTQSGLTSSIQRITATMSSVSLDFNARLPKPYQIPSTPYSDMDFERISAYLRTQNHEDWSIVPRLFTVLTLIDRSDALSIFIQNGMDDMWFPFEMGTLPPSLQSSTKSRFLEIQEVVYGESKAHQLESGAKRHALFGKDDYIPFVSKKKLGRGAHGTVDKVISTISYKEYARKLFRKPKVGKNNFANFKTELDILKKVRHRHCVSLVSTYADVKYFAMILSPVGDCNLNEFYSEVRRDEEKLSMLRSFYGCLARAVQYLHDKQIRHRDIKPQNVIVRDDQVYLADFGIAHSWEGLTGSTTTADSGRTQIYAAPEVVRVEPRNESADVWALGCVFFEMATVLKGETVADLQEKHFLPRSESRCFCHNVAHLDSWAEALVDKGLPEDDLAFGWARRMLQDRPGERPDARSLCNLIAKESASCSLMFCGTCCGDGFETVTVTDQGEDQDTMWDFESHGVKTMYCFLFSGN
ncbi:kinase-like protein [Apiospora hydei]|uniref:Kinase-like protein n=1 Tax=Apiospora hydei TaxID=1337664 RepID=A0ABR1VVS3_9PEZI